MSSSSKVVAVGRLGSNGRLSQSIAHAGTVYLTGQTGEGVSIEEQTASALASVDQLLAAAGSSKSNIVQATIWLADRNDFDGMNSVWDNWVDRDHPPARSTGILALLLPGWKIEVTVVAALPNGRQ